MLRSCRRAHPAHLLQFWPLGERLSPTLPPSPGKHACKHACRSQHACEHACEQCFNVRRKPNCGSAHGPSVRLAIPCTGHQ
eukprot:354731-Chlamydomonas_euryale.AAC.8